MFPVQISVFISKVQVHLDPQEINVSKYNRSMERRRGEHSQWQWKPQPLQNTAGLCWGAGLTQQPYLSLKDKLGWRIWPLIQQGLCTTLTLQSLSDRFACCCQRDGESFSVPALHFPLLSQLYITKHQRPQKPALKIPEQLCAKFSSVQGLSWLRRWCWDLATTRIHLHTFHKHTSPFHAGECFRKETTERHTALLLTQHTCNILHCHQTLS